MEIRPKNQTTESAPLNLHHFGTTPEQLSQLN